MDARLFIARTQVCLGRKRLKHVRAGARGHLSFGYDHLFGSYFWTGYPLANQKNKSLSVPSGGEGYEVRSKVK